jgi:CelD/BcsL family acetyltransferase involved in cellulose biosynthesis
MRLEADSVGGLRVLAQNELPADWPSAADRGNARCYVFQTREFIQAWQESFGRLSRVRPWFVTVSDGGGNTVLRLPLSVERRQLRFIDHGNADYNAPVLYDGAPDLSPAITRALMKNIAALIPGVDLVVLEKMPETVQALRNPLRSLAHHSDGAAAHGNDLRKPWPAIEKTLGEARNVKRKLRALSEVDETRLVVADTPEMRDRLIADLIALKHRRFEQMKIRGFAENPEGVAFLRRASSLFEESGNGLLVALMVGDTAAAVQWGLVHADSFYGLVTSFAPAWADYSCGRILAHQLTRYLYDRGIHYLDQGYGDESYKLQSSDTTVPLFREEIAVTPPGYALLAGCRLIAEARASRWWGTLRAARWTATRAIRRRAPGAAVAVPTRLASLR